MLKQLPKNFPVFTFLFKTLILSHPPRLPFYFLSLLRVVYIHEWGNTFTKASKPAGGGMSQKVLNTHLTDFIYLFEGEGKQTPESLTQGWVSQPKIMT